MPNRAGVCARSRVTVPAMQMDVSVTKADFGEGEPANGLYASGRTGFYEHNLYPLRYNQAVAEITKQITGDTIIWGRSAWAGSQRYPLHWGGDAENTNSAMAAELRGGLSFGPSGFTYWSHDAGPMQLATMELNVAPVGLRGAPRLTRSSAGQRIHGPTERGGSSTATSSVGRAANARAYGAAAPSRSGQTRSASVKASSRSARI